LEINDLTLGIIGSGGDGVISAGEIMVSSASSEGLYCFMLKSFGPQIRGGESSCQVRISTEQVLSQGDEVDVMVVFNWQDFKRFQSEIGLNRDAIIFYEENDPTPEDELPLPKDNNYRLFKVPFIKISKESVGSVLGKNIVSLGMLSEMFNISKEGIRKAVVSRFTKKGEEVVQKNLKAFEAGINYVKNIKLNDDFPVLNYEKTDPKLVLSGNDAIAYGALFAGCRFFAGYPITPSSEIMERFSIELPKVGGVFVQTEDEIAAASMVIGASFAGKKAMTATSGPGISLMCESIGLASIAEIPSVFVNVQRVGPSTGVPTKSEQADLQQALYGTHGAAPRVVIAPADVEDCFDCAVEAFNIAEKYQMPVLILSDQFIGQRIESVRKINFKRFQIEEREVPAEKDLSDGNYLRYKLTKSGISPMSYPGIKGGEYLASGIEHTESGAPSSEYLNHEKMNEKRFKKYTEIRTDLKFIRRYGPYDAEVGIIGWGSSKGVIKEAVINANEQGYKIAALIPQVLYPLPYKQFDQFLAPLKKIIVAELSYSGQFYKYLRGHFDLPKDTVLLKRSGAKPFTVNEIYKTIKEVFEEWDQIIQKKTTKEISDQFGVPDVETLVL